MEIGVNIRGSSNRDMNIDMFVDIHIEGMDVTDLPLFHADGIRDMVRPQVMAILRYKFRDATEEEIKLYASAIVDGTPLSRSACQGDKSDGQDSDGSDTPPHTKEDS